MFCTPGPYPGSSHTVQLSYLSSVEEIYNSSPTAQLNFQVSGFIDMSNTEMNHAGGGFGSITGSSGADQIYGSALDDMISGGGGNDNLSGGKGNDILYGGAGADTFIFYANDGTDTVVDYTDGTDKIRIHAPGIVSSFADVTVTASGSGTRLDFAGTTALLPGVDPTLIDASDFIL